MKGKNASYRLEEDSCNMWSSYSKSIKNSNNNKQSTIKMGKILKMTLHKKGYTNGQIYKN